MPTPLDHLFALVLVVLFPVRAALVGFRRLEAAEPWELPRVRLWLYRQGIAIQWTLAAIAVALWVWQRRPWTSLGVVPLLNGALLGVAAGIVIVLIFVVRQRARTLADDEALARLRRQLENVERMMPRSPEELSWFGRLAVTAGICEELLYRGYLIWYLAHWLGLIPAALLSSVAFGFGHAYQGPRGVALTALVGAFMSAVYLLTGSLFCSMVLHALMDLHAGAMGQAAFAREEQGVAGVDAPARWEPGPPAVPPPAAPPPAAPPPAAPPSAAPPGEPPG